MLSVALMIVLVLLIIGSIPGAWPHTKNWSRGPMALLTVFLLVVLVLTILKN